MELSYGLLHEGRGLYAWMRSGIGMSVLAVILFTAHGYVARTAHPWD